MSTVNQRRAQQLADIRSTLEGVYEECEDLYLQMGGDNRMSRLWSRKVTDPVGETIFFIDELQRKAKKLGVI